LRASTNRPFGLNTRKAKRTMNGTAEGRPARLGRLATNLVLRAAAIPMP
jgi:hypothetical protein